VAVGIVSFIAIGSPSMYAPTILTAGPVGGSIAAFCILLGTSRIRIVGNELLEIDSLAVRRLIDPDAIAEITRKNGLQIVLSDGRTIGAASHAPALGSLVTGNHHARKAAAKIDSWMVSPRPTPPPGTPPVRTTLKPHTIALVIVLIVGTPLLGLLTHAIWA
jgi:hypothetical protein